MQHLFGSPDSDLVLFRIDLGAPSLADASGGSGTPIGDLQRGFSPDKEFAVAMTALNDHFVSTVFSWFGYLRRPDSERDADVGS